MKLYEVNENTTYKDFAILWIEHHKTFIKESSYANYKNAVYGKLIPFFGDAILKNINKRMIQNFIVSLNLSTKSIKDFIITFKQSMNYLFENEIVNEFSFKGLKYKKENKKKIEFLNKKEYKSLKEYCIKKHNKEKDLKYELGILIAISTGMRIGEICALKFCDIDMQRKIIYVNKTLQRIYTPDEKTKIIIGTPKSSSSVREIPITNDVYKLLKDMHYKIDHYVIRNEKYTEPRMLRKKFNIVLNETGIKKIKFHSLRHTFATLCLGLNVDVKTVSELLGHANAKMTLDIYAHTTLEQKQKAIKVINAL